MKLLFDQNLSPKLTLNFDEYFEDVKHVQDLGLDRAEDDEILQYARSNSFTIVTKDSDFGDLISIFGFPPKIIWIRRGNCSIKEIITLLKENLDRIRSFGKDKVNGILNIF